MISAFGDFEGGQLNYWPEDDKGCQLEELPEGKKVTLKIGDGLALFNGNSAHSVNDFTGNRFSIVYFTLGCHAKASPEVKKALEDLGMPYPAKEEDPRTVLRGPHGYGQRPPARPLATSTPAYRFW